MKVLLAIASFFKSLFSEVKDLFWKSEDFPIDEIDRNEKQYFGEFIDDLPPENKIEENKIYIVGENGYEWLVALRCPCGCGDLVQLNLLENGNHVWRIVKRSPKRISIRPSIDRTIGCRSHFNITNGEVIWWKDQNI